MNITSKAALALLAITSSSSITKQSSCNCMVNAFQVRNIIPATIPNRHDVDSITNNKKHSFKTSTTLSSSSDYSGDTDKIFPSFETEQDYTNYLKASSALPQGFATGTAQGTFIPEEAPLMGELGIKGTIIHLLDGPTDSWAATFTQNKFPGAPILVGKKRLESQTPIQTLIINNKISNVCSGGDGVANSEFVCEAVAKELNLSAGPTSVLPSSTGVIGWRLPAKELAESVVPDAVKSMQSESAFDAARDIMTTDRYPKLRSVTLSNGARVIGIAKGAGMIEPNMATMLCYIMTDATLPRSKLQSMLSEVVDQSFNSISVDGDESTSDTTVLISSNKVEMSSPDVEEEFKTALMEISTGLAGDLVRNGEGTGHVMRVQIKNFPGTELEARRLGRHIVNSPLFKCAVSGNDPNTGRLAGAIGSFMGKFKAEESVEKMVMTLGDRVIFKNGKFVLEGNEVERELSDHMKDAQLGEVDEFPQHQKFVEIGVDFCSDSAISATVLGSDLTNEYVAVNADYRS